MELPLQSPELSLPMKQSPFLDGQMLIAMPTMGDPRFERSLIFMCAHSENGAMGIIVNKRAPMLSFAELLERLDITRNEEHIKLPGAIESMPVQFGGPVEPGRGFVLHTADYYSSETTLPIDEGVALTATLDILRAIAQGTGPRRVLLALGYAGWGPGQLDGELEEGSWIVEPARPEDVFTDDPEELWSDVLRRKGGPFAVLAAMPPDPSRN
jgi:putative transcriptional regulator